MKQSFIFGLVLLTAVPVTKTAARIGETLEQCRARYGREQSNRAPDEYTFLTNSILISVSLESNLVTQISYGTSETSPFSDEMILHLLKANASETWTNTAFGEWHAPKAKLTALVMPTVILIYSDEARRRRQEEIRQWKMKSIEGF
jgi:hypothetical protein